MPKIVVHITYYILHITCCIFSSFAQAQLLDSSDLQRVITYTSISQALEHPESVYKLNLSKQKLKVFPMEITQLKNLQELDLSKNKIIEIPKEIELLTHLQELDASKNKLEKIPPEIGNLKNLRHLNLGRNEIVNVPKEIGQLEQLLILDMWDNNLNNLPDEIQNLKNLKVLELRGILFSEEEHARLKTLLPNTQIYLSPSCNCKN